MRSGYAPVNNYQKRGEIGISHCVFETIANRVVTNIAGAKINKRSRKWLFDIVGDPIRATVHSNGRVDLAMDIVIKAGVDVQAMCLAIQQQVSSAVAMMCETVPFQVSVRVVGIQA